MVLVKAPQAYISQSGIIKEAGGYIKKWGSRAYILGGPTALAVIGEDFFKSLEANGIHHTTELFQGYPTNELVADVAKRAKEEGADVLIGVGGGRALDTAKNAGQKAGIPVITVPTIAATCAAWSALSVLYTTDGASAGGELLQHSPVLVLADLDIIAKAPSRYLKAGIADTIVKWYETAPALKRGWKDIHLRLEVKIAELALEVLYSHSFAAVEEVERQIPGEALKEIVDAIIFLAGIVGSVRSDALYGEGLAHPFYNSTTFVANTRTLLHGEKVNYGLLVQLVLEEQPLEEIEKVLAFTGALDLPITLEQIGIADNEAQDVAVIAQRMEYALNHHRVRKFKPTREQIAKAVIQADSIAKIFFAKQKAAV